MIGYRSSAQNDDGRAASGLIDNKSICLPRPDEINKFPDMGEQIHVFFYAGGTSPPPKTTNIMYETHEGTSASGFLSRISRLFIE